MIKLVGIPMRVSLEKGLDELMVFDDGIGTFRLTIER